MSTYSAKSTFMGLITRGKFWGLLTPWRIEIDTDRKFVEIRKRNWHLISVDEQSFQFSSVRNIKIDTSIFGADLHIRMYAGQASVYGIAKADAKKIRNMLFDAQASSEKGNRSQKENEIYLGQDDLDDQ